MRMCKIAILSCDGEKPVRGRGDRDGGGWRARSRADPLGQLGEIPHKYRNEHPSHLAKHVSPVISEDV